MFPRIEKNPPFGHSQPGPGVVEWDHVSEMQLKSAGNQIGLKKRSPLDGGKVGDDCTRMTGPIQQEPLRILSGLCSSMMGIQDSRQARQSEVSRQGALGFLEYDEFQL